MQGIAVETRRGVVTIRPLRNGDVETVQAVLAALSSESRRLRFGSTSLPARDGLEALAQVGTSRHVLVAYGDRRPIGIAHLALEKAGGVAEIAVAVVDEWQRAGIGSELLRLMTSDAALLGVRHIRAIVRLENRASISMVRRVLRIVSRRVEGGELELVAAIG
jgi:L-amino acid N-acyltransferase YncA